jgi:hypothetical protein
MIKEYGKKTDENFLTNFPKNSFQKDSVGLNFEKRKYENTRFRNSSKEFSGKVNYYSKMK